MVSQKQQMFLTSTKHTAKLCRSTRFQTHTFLRPKGVFEVRLVRHGGSRV